MDSPEKKNWFVHKASDVVMSKEVVIAYDL